MVTAKHSSIATSSKSHHRASRIRDAEWEIWRHKLIKLYMEDDVSRKDIIETMEREHGFMINDKQLKHRFLKWEVKKYIRGQDMAAMMSYQRQHEAPGQRIRFRYRGHEVEPTRLARAFKRRRSALPSNVALPSYIQASVPNDHSQTEGSDVPTIGLSRSGAQLSSSDMSTLHSGPLKMPDAGQNAAEVQVDRSISAGGDEELCGQASEHTALATNDLLSGDLDNVEDLWLAPLSPWDFLEQGTIPFKGIEGDQIEAHSTVSLKQLGSLNSRDTCSSISLQMLLESPLNEAGNSGFDQQYLLGPERTFSNKLETFHQESGIEKTSNLMPRGVSITQMDPTAAKVSVSNPVDCNSHTMMVLSQLLYAHFIASLERFSPRTPTFGDHSSQTIINVIKSSWLRNEFENFFCAGFIQATGEVPQHQGFDDECDLPLRNSCSYGSGTKSAEERLDEIVRPFKAASATHERTLSSHIIIITATGTLRVHVKTIPGQREGSCTVCVSFIPKIKVRATGVSAIFSRIVDELLAPRIQRHVETFNVVPQDSAIIKAVLINDVRSVQRLFDRGEASPLDVDPNGYSLLSYATNSGGPEVFLMLLQGGASTQNCDHYGTTLDIVWIIWFRYVDYISHARNPPDLTSHIGYFDQCVRMTDAALERFCDTDESVCYNHDRANVLFELSDCPRLTAYYSQFPREALNYLINKGINIEKRNYLGLTPLLHSVKAYRPQALACLETFIARGADIHAVDLKGNGALHLALYGPWRFYNFGRRQHLGVTEEADASDYWRLRLIYHTEEDSSTMYSCGHHEVCEKLGNEPGIQGQEQIFCEDDIGQHTLDARYDSDDFVVPQDFGGPQRSDLDFTNILPLIRCRDYDGFQHVIRHPVKVLKIRLRSVLITLLRAGCDPNALNDVGNPPSHYARRNALWPEWSWALRRAGYDYDMMADRWVQLVGF